MSLRPKLTLKAKLDAANSYVWLVEHRSQMEADRWRDQFTEAIRRLPEIAARCPEAPEAEWIGQEIRQLLVGPRKNAHRILFRIQDGVVEILRVRHVRQDFLDADDLA